MNKTIETYLSLALLVLILIFGRFYLMSDLLFFRFRLLTNAETA